MYLERLKSQITM